MGNKKKQSKPDGHNKEALKGLCCGYLVANPLGCIIMFAAVIAAMGFAGYELIFPSVTLCLNASFSDFQVTGSEIVEHYYIDRLIGFTSYQNYLNNARRRGLDAEFLKKPEDFQSFQDSENSGNFHFTQLNENELETYSKHIQQQQQHQHQTNSHSHSRKLHQYSSSDYSRRDISIVNLYVFFYDRKGDDVLTRQHMNLAHEVENAIKETDGYYDHCLLYEEDGDYDAQPPESFLNFLYPTIDGDQWTFDGLGDELCCNVKETAISLVESNEEYYTYFDFSFQVSVNPNDTKSEYLVSIFQFGYSSGDQTKDDLQEWVASYDNKLSKYRTKSGFSKLGVAYTDSDGVILYNQLINYVYQDLELAVFSLILIFVVVYLYVRSLFLSIFGLVGVVASFIPSLVLYQYFYGDVFNIVNCASVWVILGIGADDIFVFVASYRRAPLITVDGRVVPNYLRMSFAYREAGAAMFCTSFTTACSFASLMFNLIQPLPQFGFLMASLVMMNFILVMTWFPCLLQAYIWFNQFWMLCGQCCCCCCDCDNKSCKCLAVPIAVKKNSKEILNDGKKKKKNQRNQGYGVDERKEDSEDRFNLAAVYGFDDDNWVVHRGYGPNMQQFIQEQIELEQQFFGSEGLGAFTGYERATQGIRDLTAKVDNWGAAFDKWPALPANDNRRDNLNNGGPNGDNWNVKSEWSACVNLYWAIQRFTGIILILFTAAMAIFLAYSMTKVGVPTQTTVLLPEWTNMGICEDAFSNMDICDDCITSSDGVQGITVGPTPSPTSAPVGRRRNRRMLEGIDIDSNSDNSERHGNERNLLQTSTPSPTERVTELSLDESIKVVLVFGGKSASDYHSECDGDISPDASVQYDENFNIYDTGTQLKGLWLCEQLAAIDDTIMRRTTDQHPCLWESFYNYSITNGYTFPYTSTNTMTQQLVNWLDTEEGQEYTQYFGVDSSSYSVTWMRQYVYTQMDNSWGASQLEEYYVKWDKWMDEFNKNDTLASDTFKGFQYAAEYVFMEVELEFLSGFYQSVGYTLLLCTLTMLLFTCNFAIVAFVCVYIILVVICVVGIYGAIGWEFGAIEVIAVPTVVGLSIDYALHITHSYVHSIYGDRVSRAKSAVDSIGCSVFASAMTTISSMIVLYYAVVVIFSDLGWIVATTTSCGIFIAVCVCPPLMGYIGPEGDQCHCRWCCNLCGEPGQGIANTCFGKAPGYVQASTRNLGLVKNKSDPDDNAGSKENSMDKRFGAGGYDGNNNFNENGIELAAAAAVSLAIEEEAGGKGAAKANIPAGYNAGDGAYNAAAKDGFGGLRSNNNGDELAEGGNGNGNGNNNNGAGHNNLDYDLDAAIAQSMMEQQQRERQSILKQPVVQQQLQQQQSAEPNVVDNGNEVSISYSYEIPEEQARSIRQSVVAQQQAQQQGQQDSQPREDESTSISTEDENEVDEADDGNREKRAESYASAKSKESKESKPSGANFAFGGYAPPE